MNLSGKTAIVTGSNTGLGYEKPKRCERICRQGNRSRVKIRFPNQ